MARWSDITSSDQYVNLSIDQKLEVKKAYAQKTIGGDPKFQSLSDEQQVEVFEKFGRIRKEDGIPLRHVRNILSEVNTNIRDVEKNVPAGSEAELGIAIAKMFGMGISKVLGKGDEIVLKAATGVETLGGIHPQGIPGGRTTAGLVVKDFPRFFAAEMMRMYKPSNIAVVMAAGPLIGKILGKVGSVVTKHPAISGAVGGGAIGTGVGAAQDEENRLRGAFKGGAVGTAIGLTGGAVAGKYREPIRHFMFVERGTPKIFQRAKRATELEREAGAREAKEVGEKLFTAQEPMEIQKIGGGVRRIRKGKALPQEQQEYVGKIFQKEVELGGARPRLPEGQVGTDIQQRIDRIVGVSRDTVDRRVANRVNAELGFQPRVQGLQNSLRAVSKELRGAESRIEGQVGKVFRTKTGFLEEAVGEGAIPVPHRVTGAIRHPETGELITRPGITTKPVAPKTGDIPADFLVGEEEVVRSIADVAKAKTIVKPPAVRRKILLKQRNELRRQLEKEVEQINVEVRAHYQLFDRKFTEQIRTHPKYKQLSKIASEGRDAMDKWSRALAKSGIPSKQAKETIEANVGEYMARVYESQLLKDPHFSASPKSFRLRLNGLKKRKELSETVLKQKGVIKAPAIPTTIRIRETSTSIANNKLFKIVESNPEWTATENITGNMVKMADSAGLGPLKGKWVVKDIADSVNSIVFTQKNLAMELYGKGLAAFKFGKVVLNPATHMRNMITNTMLLDMSGVNHAHQARLFPKVMADYAQKGPLYQQALKSGAIGGEFFGGDVKIMLDHYMAKTDPNHLSRMFNTLKIPFQKAGQVYQAEEQVAKMVKFAHTIEKTSNVELAATEAQKWLFNYTDVPEAVKVAKHVAPFITFTYKSIPRVAETAVKNPLKLYKYFSMFKSYNEASQDIQGMTPVEYAKEINALPPWLSRDIGGFPSVLLIPYKDKAGRAQWLNLEYILPLGMAPDIMEKGLGQGMTAAARAFVGNPFLNTFSELMVANKDFTGKDIVPFGATRKEASDAMLSYVYRQFAPSLAPSLGDIKGGYSFEKLMDAIHKKKSKIKPDQLKRELTPTVLDVFMGLKVTPVDVNVSNTFKAFEIQKNIKELEGQLRSMMLDPNITEEDKNKKKDGFFKKIQKESKRFKTLDFK